MREEISAEVKVGGLLWVVENFFEHYPLDQPPNTSAAAAHHEVGLCIEMELPPHLTELTALRGVELVGTSDEFTLEYQWFDRTELGSLDVRPARIAELVARPLSEGSVTIVNVD